MVATPAPVQRTYQRYLTFGQVGQAADMSPLGSGVGVDTKICETAAGIGFGLAVSQGVAWNGVVLGQPGSPDGQFVGISLADITLANLKAPGPDIYQLGENMGVKSLGDVVVLPATNVEAGDKVYFNSATGQLGDGTISNAILIPDARWMTTSTLGATTAGVQSTNPADYTAGLAIVRLGQASGIPGPN
jgi:hypothetical protein